MSNSAGKCRCSRSFFVGPDGVGRIVSSGGDNVITWQIVNNGTTTKLVQEASALIAPPNQYDAGFQTTVSSNGTENAIIWAVTRPSYGGSSKVNLYAFGTAPVNGTLPQLGVYQAGFWDDKRDLNIIPVVANGRVFVASRQELTIFGFK